MPNKTSKLSDLIPDKRNANKGTQEGSEALSSSITKYKAGRSVLLDKNGNIIAGNKTVHASQSAGIEDVIIVPTDGSTLVAVQRTDIDIDSEHGRGLAIADNRVSEISLDWDEDELKALSDEGFLDLKEFWSDEEIDELIGIDPPREDEEALEDLAEDIEGDGLEERVKEGEVWKLGNHYIACGDCTKEENIQELKSISRVEIVDVVWSDPPYGISIVSTSSKTSGYVGKGDAYNIPFGGVKNKKSLGSSNGSKAFGSAKGSVGGGKICAVGKYEPIAGDDSIDVAYKSSSVYLDKFPEAVHCWWGGNYYSSNLPDSNCWIVWDKENTGNFADAELAWTNNSSAVRIFKHMWNGMVKASEHGQKRVHPTQKPVALARWFIENYCSNSKVLIDPFLGSGMSLIAAQETNKKCIGFELSPHYCTVIIQRWERLTGEVAEKVGDL